jgi:hypothetical protein
MLCPYISMLWKNNSAPPQARAPLSFTRPHVHAHLQSCSTLSSPSLHCLE